MCRRRTMSGRERDDGKKKKREKNARQAPRNKPSRHCRQSQNQKNPACFQEGLRAHYRPHLPGSKSHGQAARKKAQEPVPLAALGGYNILSLGLVFGPIPSASNPELRARY